MADIMLKEIENGVSITTPNGHEYIYTVYPWRVDKINPADLGKTAVRNKDYNDITFNKECGTLRRTNRNVAMLNIAKLLADINRFMYNDGMDEEHKKKVILAMELAYKNKVATFGLAYGLSDGDRVLLRNLKYVSTKNISQAIAKKEKYNDVAQFLQEAISLSLKNKLSSTILKHISLTKSDSSALLCQSTFNLLVKYQKEIEYMLTAQDKKVQEIENIVNNIMNSIPNYVRGWLYYKPQSVFKIKDEYKKTNKQISLIEIIDTLKYVERTCTEMGITNTDYIKNKSYSEFLISADELKKVYKDYLEKHKFELFEKRQQKLPKYSKTIDEHKIELVIPYTFKDCKKIGEDFHNCFGAYEWNEYLITGVRYGCALYMDNTPYICLDIDIGTNVIHQYLYSHNRSIGRVDDIAIMVKNELQNLFLNIK